MLSVCQVLCQVESFGKLLVKRNYQKINSSSLSQLRGEVAESQKFVGVLSYSCPEVLGAQELAGGWDPRQFVTCCTLSEAVRHSEASGALCNRRRHFVKDSCG